MAAQKNKRQIEEQVSKRGNVVVIDRSQNTNMKSAVPFIADPDADNVSISKPTRQIHAIPYLISDGSGRTVYKRERVSVQDVDISVQNIPPVNQAVPYILEKQEVESLSQHEYMMPEYSKEEYVEDYDREYWGGRFNYFFACLAYSISLVTVFNFPYLTYIHGGAPFLLVYFLMVFLFGIPLFFMESALGQFCSLGIFNCWTCVPLLTGIGGAMFLACLLVCLYYSLYVAWAIFYLIASFTVIPELPWATCNRGNWWNTRGPSSYCLQLAPATSCSDPLAYQAPNGTCFGPNGTVLGIWNQTLAKGSGIAISSSAKEYFWRYFLEANNNGIDNVGDVIWQSTISLVGVWFIVFLCLCLNTRSSGKVVYLSAIFPYICLIILLVGGLMLPGSQDGLNKIFGQNWQHLLDSRLWKDAAVQVVFTLGLGWGAIITLNSYNHFKAPVWRSSLLVCIVVSLTSVLSVAVVYTYIGHLEYSLSMDNVTDSLSAQEIFAEGPEGIFVVVAHSISRIGDLRAFWAVWMFLLVLSVGIDTLFIWTQVLLTAIIDYRPSLRNRKIVILLFFCLVFLLFGFLLCTQGGVYAIWLLDNSITAWPIVTILFLESITISWVYGWSRFSRDIQLMIGGRQTGGCSYWWWRAGCQVIAPIMMLYIMFFEWVDWYQEIRQFGDYQYPTWANWVGIILGLIAILPIFVVAIFRLCRAKGSMKERLIETCTPAKEWGPTRLSDRLRVMEAEYVFGFALAVHPHHKILGSEPGSDKQLISEKNVYTTLNVVSSTSRPPKIEVPVPTETPPPAYKTNANSMPGSLPSLSSPSTDRQHFASAALAEIIDPPKEWQQVAQPQQQVSLLPRHVGSGKSHVETIPVTQKEHHTPTEAMEAPVIEPYLEPLQNDIQNDVLNDMNERSHVPTDPIKTKHVQLDVEDDIYSKVHKSYRKTPPLDTVQDRAKNIYDNDSIDMVAPTVPSKQGELNEAYNSHNDQPEVLY
ncbi:unnamed protein product [Owenia fusiformis]|uniref:Transporter n=1 Tax=Owenia fusiformis TaxID=6347 RepID=A0A8S4N4G0_OWEFU|nr:unnamed protein product [Owenia fusiformis]